VSGLFHHNRLDGIGIVVRVRNIGSALALACQQLADVQRHVVIKRTGMCLLIADTQLGQQVEDDTGLHLEFPR